MIFTDESDVGTEGSANVDGNVDDFGANQGTRFTNGKIVAS